MVFGKVDFNGDTYDVGAEFVRDQFGNQLVLHFPKDVDTKNWFHGVMLRKDLKVVFVVDKSEEG